MNIDKTLLKIASIVNIMKDALDSKNLMKKECKDFEQIINEYDIICENSETLKYFIKNPIFLLNIDSEHTTDIKEINNIFDYIDEYLFTELGLDLYLFELKPSEILRAFIDEEHQNLSKNKDVFLELLNAYNTITENLIWLENVISNFDGPNFFINTDAPNTLSVSIQVKWEIYVRKINIIASMKKPKKVDQSHQIVVYSINSCDLAGEMSKVIKHLLIEKTEEELTKNNIKKSLMQNNIFSVSKFETYDVMISDKNIQLKSTISNRYQTFHQVYLQHI